MRLNEIVKIKCSVDESWEWESPLPPPGFKIEKYFCVGRCDTDLFQIVKYVKKLGQFGVKWVM